MRVSLIIPAFNEAHYLGRCLDSLLGQTLARTEFDVLVVDNGSTDATREIACQHRASRLLHLRVISRPKVSIAAVRNFGASQTIGEILAFLDADCVPDADWLERALAMAPEGGLWGAHYRVPEDATWVGKTWFRYQAREMSGPVSFLPGGDLFCFRRDFRAVGGFNEAARTSEDVEFSTRVTKAGLPVVAIPELSVVHLGTPRTLAGFYLQNRWHGQEVFRLFLRNLPSIKNLPLLLLSLSTLVMLCLTPLGVISYFLWHSWELALIPAVLLLLPPFLIAMRKSAGSRFGVAFGRLFTLYLIYFLARAAALRRMFQAASFAERGRVKT